MTSSNEPPNDPLHDLLREAIDDLVAGTPSASPQGPGSKRTVFPGCDDSSETASTHPIVGPAPGHTKGSGDLALARPLAELLDEAINELVDACAGGTATKHNLECPMPTPGECFGNYRLDALLGRGGMGVVFDAIHLETGRRLALKVLEEGISSDEMRKRFFREGRLAASINHPNSVYIFGAEEIEGHPVITMELVHGGTLKDELSRRGALPVAEAVDAILQIIAGLEAAADAGVLHRDIKPSNCFVSTDGSVKVGDFGLSVSTAARMETQLTASGRILGTPSFASPEQLRGDEMDARSDIYSVGATLYSLLAGCPPFDGPNAVQVIASVLSKDPPPILSNGKEVPKALNRVVMRCLAKRPQDRFPDYASLRRALLPFSSSAREPASLRRRVLAGFIDQVLFFAPLTFLYNWLGEEMITAATEATAWPLYSSLQGMIAAEGAANLVGLVIVLGLVILRLSWHLLPLYWRGRTLGKAMVGLHVVTQHGRSMSFGRACWRVVIWSLFVDGPGVALVIGYVHSDPVEGSELSGLWAILAWVVCLHLGWWLACLSRKELNGYAALHDLWTGTRVVRGWGQVRAETVEWPSVLSVPPESQGPLLGPYQVCDKDDLGLLLAIDRMFGRFVWITREVALPARQNVDRQTRSRWLTGGCMDGRRWSAYEATPGLPLLAIAPQSQSWTTVRQWLAELANELEAATLDGTLPAQLTVGHIWITWKGRAMLLDKAWIDRPPPVILGETDLTPQGVLNAVASHVLKPTSTPIHARAFLAKLSEGMHSNISEASRCLQSLLRLPGEVSRRRRTLSLVAYLGVVSLVAIFGNSRKIRDIEKADAAWTTFMPEAIPLSQLARQYETLSDGWMWTQMSGVRHTEGMRIQLRRETASYIVTHFGHLINTSRSDSETTPNMSVWPVKSPQETLERRVVAEAISEINSPREDTAHIPGPLPAETAALSLRVTFREQEIRWLHWRAVRFMGGSLIWLAAMQLIFVLIGGALPGQFVFGLIMVDQQGASARRLRLLFRWACCWLIPTMVGFAAPLWLSQNWVALPASVARMSHQILINETLESVALLLIAAFWAIPSLITPERGIPDRLAETWWVMR